MTRTSRRKSNSGYYHIILRGVNRQDIFFDDKDREKLLGILQRFQEETDVQISAYCLMDNHIHLLIHTMDGPEQFVKRLASSYVFYFNRKYDRVGHLFQDRYRSETIETEASLLTVFRYILQNPMKAGLGSPETYPWSSYRSIEGQHDFCDISRIIAIAGNRQVLKGYVLKQNNDYCLEEEPVMAFSEADALQKAMRITGGENPLKIALHPKEKRDLLIARMKKAGLSIRQISRLTGINRNTVWRA